MDRVEDSFINKTVLVTGGAGAIGGNLVRKLIDLDTKKITILDNLSSSYEWNIPKSDKVQFIKGDILDDVKLKWVFKSKPDIVYHLAAHFANQNSVDKPETDLMINGLGILKVLEYAQLCDVERFIYSSSGCGVYGLDSKMPFEEHDVSINLHTPYQVTKLLGELYTNYYHNLYNLPIVNARFFNSFGPGEVPGKYRNVIPNFFYWSMKGLPLPITGTGEETRDFTYVGDITDGLLAMAHYEKAIGEAFNLGASREIMIKDLASWINELTGNDAGINFKERRDWDAKSRLLSCINKAGNVLNYKPKVEFRDGLKETHQWFVDNWDNIQKFAEF
ncbi:NAD-dependent epimerase/dehydratase family protein [Methanomicrobium antiquum]|uniref:NAD-dependent epimerase/dehydratase family protein n=1 Tax=Methanomicrobium antiquum TaxID=487686 RepID=A0AAF0FSN3_9EURY|nr:NAD-dependent epimerase/dehydratase family protein [Methanomicrobium antiquum]WFN37396.1 NAD-dependent epimerase/dehydratase family protein [Methanomicrobium antiquum]